MNLRAKIRSLSGPILIMGGSGFIGTNLLRACLEERTDVIGTTFGGDSWRLAGIPAPNVAFLNVEEPTSVRSLLLRVRPKTIFDCISFGAYSFEQDVDRIHTTNYLSLIHLLEAVSTLPGIDAYIHAGSSSEYGLNAAGPAETGTLHPNSHYAVSKAAAAQAIFYFGKIRRLPVVNLRLYSVYGPYEDSSRLIPVLCEKLLKGQLPIFANRDVSRDYVHVSDAVHAFVDASLNVSPELAGESLNIGTGIKTTMSTLAEVAVRVFAIKEEPRFDPGKGRHWDVEDWFADSGTAKKVIGWQPKVSLEEGLVLTRDWWKGYLAGADFSRLTKKTPPRGQKSSISAIVACYRDAQAIPIMYERLVAVFRRLDIDYEIIFVNDASPDDSGEIIRRLSSGDPRIIGVEHARNFGSQSAFRSGMELASKEACVLLDGDLQDPPEIIEQFVAEWRRGADVVYGQRVRRDMPVWLEACYRAFYRLFAALSEVSIPKDAGDFSLMDRSVVYWMLECRERDSFLRGLRAYIGFKQVGVPYVRPERMFGASTNNWLKNIGWAKKAIFSFSRVPLHALTAFGAVACVGTAVLALASLAVRLASPGSTPRGATFISLLVMFFGSTTTLGIGLLGEYIGKILEETKARPPFIRRNIISRGEVKPAEFRERFKP
jgi:dolichol-phosphate mannosyltransferase